MQLLDYLRRFLQSQSRSSIDFTDNLEREAQAIKALIMEKDNVSSGLDLQRVKDFLVDIQKWKADCRDEQAVNAIRNNPSDIWSALRQAINAIDDKTALLSIMGLLGFGLSRDRETGQRRAKRATVVLRFLDPENWGVVDWRVIAVLGLYRKDNLVIDLALQEAKKYRMNDMARMYDSINEDAAIEIVRQYRGWRSPSLPRAVDVELALYGASFAVWPRPR